MRRQRRTGLLDDRARLILRALVEEHIRTALPVGSASIADSYRLGVSSATVRGVLAELEELGLVAQPHTSAGRIPTDQGYRTYAVEIAVPDEVTEVDRLMIRHQFGQAEGGGRSVVPHCGKYVGALNSRRWTRHADAPHLRESPPR